MSLRKGSAEACESCILIPGERVSPGMARKAWHGTNVKMLD